MSYRSAEDVQREHERILGPKLGPVFHGLYVEITWLHDKWREYRTLFGTSPERIDLLQEAAGRFFGYVQDVLWEDVLLHISRITDAPGTGKRTTLSVQQLPCLIVDPALSNQVDGLVTAAVQASAFARDWRNRFLAHRDLSFAIDQSPVPLQPASRLLVEEAMDALSAIAHAVYEHHFGGGIDLDVPGGPGDAMDLLHVLRDGVDAIRSREERFRTGNLSPADLKSRPAV